MKKRIVLASIVMAVFSLAFVLTAGLHARTADDYKVIKNAVKSSQGQEPGRGDAHWLKIEVIGRDGRRVKAKISLPLSLVELLINACPEEKIRLENECRIDIRKVWHELKKAGPQALVEAEDHDETVRIWLE